MKSVLLDDQSIIILRSSDKPEIYWKSILRGKLYSFVMTKLNRLLFLNRNLPKDLSISHRC